MSDARVRRAELVSRVGCIVVAAAAVGYVYLAHGVRLKYFVLGSGSWGFGVLLKMALHATVMKRFTREQLATRKVAFLSGLVSGATELGLAALFLSFLGELTFWQVVAFGTGIGAVEAWVVATTPDLLKGTVLEEGVRSLESAIANLPAGQRFVWEALVPILERVLALVGHVATRGLIYVACRTFDVLPALLALLAFVLLDGVLAFRTLLHPGPDQIRRLVQFYVWFTLIAAASAALCGWYWIPST